MFRNYLKIAFRNLGKNRSSSLINVLGLAIGLACCLLIGLYMQYELSYDRFYPKSDRIVRVVKDFVDEQGERLPDATTPPALAPAMETELPEVIETVRFFTIWGGDFLVEKDDQYFYGENLVFVDSTYFELFELPVIDGDLGNALRSPYEVVLTRSSARKYFGKTAALDQQLTIDGQSYTVTAVVEDIPANAHFNFDLFLPMVRLGEFDQNWGWYNFYTYALLNEPVQLISLNEKLQELYSRHNPDARHIYYAQPLADIHLRSNLKWEMAANGDIRNIYAFAFIAVLVLLIAGANYINLMTARAGSRATEVGVRKAIGACRRSLIGQFLTESMVVALLAGIIAVILVEVSLPFFNHFAGVEIGFLTVRNTWFLLGLAGAVLAIGFFAGIYPAFVLSSFHPVGALSTYKAGRQGKSGLRRGLVVGQFAIAAALITSVLVVFQQMDLLKSKDPGFNRDQLLVLPYQGELQSREVLKERLGQLAVIEQTGSASAILGGLNWTQRMSPKGRTVEEGLLVNTAYIDWRFIETAGIRIAEGRGFSQRFPADSTTGVILNETAARNLGLMPPYAGREIVLENDEEGIESRRIVGVVRDFHFSSFREPIKPYAFLPRLQYAGNVYLRTGPVEESVVLAAVQQTWEAVFPHRPFRYFWVEDKFEELHRNDEQFSTVIFVFTLLAILIAGLGLFALVAYTTEQRTREIGIRKVLGASVVNIMILLSRDFVRLIIAGLSLAIPLSWFGMNRWLEDFAYRIEIEWWIFALASGLAMITALLSMALHALHAATANPVDALRSE